MGARLRAIRYTPPGGKVQIQACPGRSATVIAVRDTGIGIAPQHLERILDRRYRVGEARNRATGGSGLGLAIARRAAQSPGARIEVDSTPGGGDFRFLLPPAHTGWPPPRRPPVPGETQVPAALPRELIAVHRERTAAGREPGECLRSHSSENLLAGLSF